MERITKRELHGKNYRKRFTRRKLHGGNYTERITQTGKELPGETYTEEHTEVHTWTDE